MTAIEVYRGDSPTFEITVTDQNGDPVDLTGAEIVFSVKKKLTDTAYVFQRKNTAAGGGDDEILIIDAVNGKFRLLLTNAVTQDLELRDYVHDFQITLGTDVHTILPGSFIVLGDVTR